MCLHRVVKITLLRKDQYGRAVCAVETMPPAGVLFKWLPGCGRQDVSAELAKAGLAELYTGGGAEYWNRREALEHAIAAAKGQKLGIWSLKNRVSAAEQKRLQKATVHAAAPPPELQLRDVTNNGKSNNNNSKRGSGGGGARTATGGSSKSNKKALTATRGGGGGAAVALKSENANNGKNQSHPVTSKNKSQRRPALLEAAFTGLEVVG